MMDKFIEDAFRQADEALDAEAKAAVRAFKENAVPTWRIGGGVLKDPEGLARAVAISGTRDDLFELMRLFFYAGFNCGAEYGRSE